VEEMYCSIDTKIENKKSRIGSAGHSIYLFS